LQAEATVFLRGGVCWFYGLRKNSGKSCRRQSKINRGRLRQAALCWLKLNVIELQYSNVMKQSITLTLGMYWEKRLTAAQRRFARACETLARVRKLSRNAPALQFNIAAEGGQQVNVSK